MDQRHPRSHELCYCNQVRRPLATDPTSSTLCRARQNHLEVDQQWIYKANSAYKAMFLGSTTTPFWCLIWCSQASTDAKFFLWLASMDPCWTTERRARHGLPHAPLCKFCSQEPESLDHLLVQCAFSMFVQCAFSRITWHEILSWCRLPVPTPSPTNGFFNWWSMISSTAPAHLRKGTNCIIA